MRLFAHFTSRADAEAIIATRELRACSYLMRPDGEGLVFGVEIGVGRYCPNVQLGLNRSGDHGFGRVNAVRDWAVVFEAADPDEVSPYGEEVVWHAGALVFDDESDLMLVPASDVIATLR